MNQTWERKVFLHWAIAHKGIIAIDTESHVYKQHFFPVYGLMRSGPPSLSTVGLLSVSFLGLMCQVTVAGAILFDETSGSHSIS